MAIEDSDIVQQDAPVADDIIRDLRHAPPEAPTPQDKQAADAVQAATQARNLSSVLRDPSGVSPSPTPIQPSEFDSGQARQPFNAAAPGSFADKMGNALHNSQQDGSASALMSQPMGWAKLILASSLQGITKPPARPQTPQVPTTGSWGTATSNADASTPTQVPQAPKRNFMNGIMANLGDAEGGGGFIGAAKRGAERQREDMKDRQMYATSNSQMLHEQQLVHIQGENQIAAAAASGKEGLAAILSAEVPGTLLAEGKNSDELKAMIQNGELDPSKQTVFLTGRVLTGKDANGQPLFRSTYSVVEPHGNVELSEKQATYLNSHLDKNLIGKTDEKPGQVLPAVQFNSLWQSAQGAEAAKAARNLALAKNNIEVRKAQIGTDADSIASNPLVVNALGGHMGSPDDPYALVKAYTTIVNNPKLLNDPRMPKNFPTVFATFAGGGDPKNFTTMQENYAKAQAKNTNTTLEMLNKFESDPKVIENATPSYSAAMNSILSDPKQTPEIKTRAASALAIIKDTEAHELQFKASEAGAKKKAEDTAGLGDVDELIESAKNYDLDPEKMFGVRGGQRAAFMNKFLKETGIPWNEGDYKARYQTNLDFKPEGKGGLQVGSLNTFAGHVGTAIQRIPALNNSASPLYNSAMNKIKVQVGDEQYGRMQTALEAVKDEYLNFLKNAHVTSTDEQARAESILNPSLSPKQIHGVLAQMADTIAIRGGQLQRNYTATMKKPYPDMLDPDSDTILKSLGANTDKMKGIPSSAQQQPHSSDLQRPQRFPTAAGTKQGSDGNLYWMDLNHKPLGRLTPEESTIANKE
jgi:hypothetical protein